MGAKIGPTQLEGGCGRSFGNVWLCRCGSHQACRWLDSLLGSDGEPRSVSARGVARSNPRQKPFPYSPFRRCSGCPALSLLQRFGCSRAVNRRGTTALDRPPVEGSCFFGKKETEQLRTAALEKYTARQKGFCPPSVCLRDSAPGGPCTFGTQFNEILQRSLRLWSLAILKASSGDMIFTRERIA